MNQLLYCKKTLKKNSFAGMILVNQTATFSGHQEPIYTAVNSQKQHIFFTAGSDRGIVEWSLKTHDLVKVMFPVAHSVYAMHCPQAAPILLSGERNGMLSVFHFVEQKLIHQIQAHQAAIFDIASLSHKKEVLVASEDGSISVWNMDNFSQKQQLQLSHEALRCISISPNERFLAFGGKDGKIYVCSAADFSLITVLEEHRMGITSLRFSPCGNYLLSGSRDAHLHIWNTSNFSLKERIPAHLFAIYDIQYSPNGTLFATASRDKSIKIWDATRFKLLKTISKEKGFEAHSHSVNKLAWSPFNNELISVGDDRKVLSWNISLND